MYARSSAVSLSGCSGRRALHGHAPRLGLARAQPVAERREGDLQLPVVPGHEDGLRLLQELVVAHGREREAEAAAVLLGDRPLDDDRVRSRPAGCGARSAGPRARRRGTSSARGGRTRRGGARRRRPSRRTTRRGGRAAARATPSPSATRKSCAVSYFAPKSSTVEYRRRYAPAGKRRQVELRLALRVVRQRPGALLGAVLPRAQPFVDGVIRRPARAEEVAGGDERELFAPSRTRPFVLRGHRLARSAGVFGFLRR